MPYDAISDLPDQTSDLTTEQKRRFLAAFNSAYEAGKGKESAFRIAWAAAKNAKGGEVSKDRVTIQADLYMRQHESVTTLSDRSTMPYMNWSSPVAKRSLEEMARLGNLPGWYAKHLREVSKNRVWVDEYTRDGQTVEGHYRSGGGAKQIVEDIAPVADFGDDQQRKFGQSAARAGAYSGIGAGAFALGRHYLRSRPTIGVAYGLYGLANIFGATQQAQQAHQIRQDDVEKIRRVTSREDFDEFMAALSEQTGDSPEDIIDGFGEWLRSKDEPPTSVTKDHLKRYLTETYGVQKDEKGSDGRVWVDDHERDGTQVEGHWRIVDQAVGAVAEHGDRVPLIGEQLQDRARQMQMRRDFEALTERLPSMSPEQRERAARLARNVGQHAGDRARNLPSDVVEAASESAQVAREQVGDRREAHQELADELDDIAEQREQTSRRHERQRRQAREQWG